MLQDMSGLRRALYGRCQDKTQLDAALEAKVACGGWCPEGRRSGYGPLLDACPVQELIGGGYRARPPRTTARFCAWRYASLVVFAGRFSTSLGVRCSQAIHREEV